MRRTAIACLLGLCVLVGWTVTSVAADSPIAVQIGVNGALTEAPFHIAQSKGYFQAEGLDVHFVPFVSAANMIAPLGAGQLDAGGGAPTAGLYNAVARGIDVRAVADLGSDPPGYGFQRLIVRTALVTSGRFKTVKDLKGMTVAVAAQGATAYVAIGTLLNKAGLKREDVKLTYLGYSDSVAAMRNGAIDAALMPEPNATFAVTAGIAKMIEGDDAFYPNQQVAVLIYGHTFLKDHRDLGVRFMRAYLRGVRYYDGALKGGKLAGPNANDVIAIMSAATSLKDEAVYRALTPHSVNAKGYVNLVSMNSDLASLRSDGLVESQALKAEDAVDNGFVTEALKSP
jgi:NitT/TauT family transport system substrate-binding protein